MDRFSVFYIFWRAWHRLYEFFYHWYVRGFLIYSGKVIDLLERLDRSLALKITLHHFGEPLFQDRSIVGRIMGFVARGGLIVIGVGAYSAVVVAAALIFIVWCLIPPYLIYKIFA